MKKHCTKNIELLGNNIRYEQCSVYGEFIFYCFKEKSLTLYLFSFC